MRIARVPALVVAVGAVLACGVNIGAAVARPAQPQVRVPYVDPFAGAADGEPDEGGRAEDGAAPPAPLVQAAVPVRPVASTEAAGVATGAAATPAEPPRTLAAWVTSVAAATGIPARAVQAYGDATLELSATAPGCHLGWPTLAALGWIESGHGTHGGATLEADGRPSLPIVGPALDGSAGRVAIRSTSRSAAWHGDAVWEHAVGPLQFLPSTWDRWAADGDGDGVADPQDLDDAALAAGRYLCAGSADLSTWAGWHGAVLAYNHDEAYVQAVFARAAAYAARVGR